MEGRLNSLVLHKGLRGGGRHWILLATADGDGGASWVILEGINGDSAAWPRAPGDEFLRIGSGIMGTVGSYHCDALGAQDLVRLVHNFMCLKHRAKLESSNAEGVVAQAAHEKINLPIYRLVGSQCELIALSDPHAADETSLPGLGSIFLEGYLTALSEFRPELSAVLAAAASPRVEMEGGDHQPPPISIISRFLNKLRLLQRPRDGESSSSNEHNLGNSQIVMGPLSVAPKRSHGDVGPSEARHLPATMWPISIPARVNYSMPGTVSGGTSASAIGEFVDIPLTDDLGLETGVLQRFFGHMAHGFGKMLATVTARSKWAYSELIYLLAVFTHGDESAGLPITTAHQEGLSERTKRLIDIMGQVYAAGLAGCFMSYSVLKDAPVYISSTIYGGLAIVIFVLYMAMLSRSQARARLAFRLVSVTAIAILTVSFVGQLSGRAYVKVLSALAGAVLILVMMLIPL